MVTVHKPEVCALRLKLEGHSAKLKYYQSPTLLTGKMHTINLDLLRGKAAAIFYFGI